MALNGKTALVTGGSRGIGLAIAKALLLEGANVALTATSASSATRAVKQLASDAQTDRVIGLAADVRDLPSVQGVVADVAQRFGGIDILVNNAGIGRFAPHVEMTPEIWNEVIGTNLTGVFHCCHAVVPLMRSRGGGWIINISSLASVNPFVNGTAYCASKAALNAFSEALMQEIRHDGIRVSYVMPGSVDTEFGGRGAAKSGWALQADDVATVVVDLLRHPSRSLPSRVEIRPSQPPRKS